jgi:hypothetical protein
MKAIIPIVAFAGLFGMTACNSSALKEKEAALQAQQHALDVAAMELTKQRVIDSMNEVTRVQYVFPQTQDMMPGTQTVTSAPKVVHVYHSAPKKRSYSSRIRSNNTSSRSAANETETVAQAPVSTASTTTVPTTVSQPAPVIEQQRKGWSAKAKGAVIGAGTGAAAGAILNGRNRVAGAVIGGILGAGAGTGIGAIIDRKNGR